MDALHVGAGSPGFPEGAPGTRSSRSTLARCAALVLAVIAVLGGALAGRAEGYVYWANADPLGNGAIGRANLDGTGVAGLFVRVDDHHVDSPCGVAVDGNHIYWVNNWSTIIGDHGASIGRANLDGSGVDENFIPLDAADNTPCGVAVDGAHVYWANQEIHIGRANLDGSGVDENFIPVEHPLRLSQRGGGRQRAHLLVTASSARSGEPTWTGAEWTRTSSPSTASTWLAGWRSRVRTCTGAHQVVENVEASVANSSIGRANLNGSGVNESFIPFDDGPSPSSAPPVLPAGWRSTARMSTGGGAFIGRANLNGSGVNQSFIPSQRDACGVAVDALESCLGRPRRSSPSPGKRPSEPTAAT